MRTVRLLYIILLLLGSAGVALAQEADDGSSQDPFKDDPFFNKPLSEFFKHPGEDLTDRHNVKQTLDRLNEQGLDYGSWFESGPSNSNMLYQVYPTLPMIHYNRVDGLFLGVREERMQWFNTSTWLLGIEGLHPHGLIGYGTASKKWQYALGLEKFIGRKHHWMAGGEYHKATTTDDWWRVGMNETTLTSLFAGYDYLDYYQVKGYGVYLNFRTDRLLEGGVSFNHDRYSSLEQHTDYSFFGHDRTYRPNPAVDEGDIESLYLSAAFNPKKLVLSRFFTFSLGGIVELADIGGFDTDYRFNKYQAESQMFVKLEPRTMLQWRLRAGSITGVAPIQRAFELGGIGSLRASPYKAYTGNAAVLSNMELHFGASAKDDGGWIDFDDFTFSLFWDAGWTDNVAALHEGNDPLEGFKHFRLKDLKNDGGLGLGTGLVRVEAAWHLQDLQESPVIWIRFNPTF